MSGGKGYTFSSDNEDEMNEWINAFQAALKKGHSDQENHQNDEALDKGKLNERPPPLKIKMLFTFKNISSQWPPWPMAPVCTVIE